MAAAANFAERLLAWWDEHGRKDLPWQHPRSPYRVWVSEIMLQQTQVTTVIPYFERFMARFPDLPALAGASEDDVLACWSGLGYYARARNLHRAARRCVEQWNGALPAGARDLAGLPGIGMSTANAIVSQTQDLPATVMDGNVKRVIARHAAVDGWPGRAAVLKKLLREADARLPEARGADYTQAIMDLGATLCTPAAPDCGCCPVRADCAARAADAVDRYPEPKPKATVRERFLAMLIARDADGSVLLERRPPAGIWGGLWCLPEAGSAAELARRFGLAPASLEPLPELQHRLTHRLLRITPLRAQTALPAKAVQSDGDLAWHALSAAAELGLPRPVRTLLERLEEEPGS